MTGTRKEGLFFTSVATAAKRNSCTKFEAAKLQTVAQGIAVQPAGKGKAWPEWILSIVAVGHQEKIVWLNQNQLASVKTTLIMSAV